MDEDDPDTGAEEQAAPPPARRGALARLARGLLRLLLALVLIVLLWVLAYRFLPPPTTPLILMRQIEGAEAEYRWRSLEEIGEAAAYAFVAAEDARFCEHFGFDLEAIRAAWKENAEGRRLRGGSTISQQVAKNAFLWPERSWLRKGLEAGFTLLIEALWPKRRILEVYLNIAQTGPEAFGVDAGAQAQFGKAAAALGPREAALIAAILPAPADRSAARPGAFTARRAASIEDGAATLRAQGGLDCVFGE